MGKSRTIIWRSRRIELRNSWQSRFVDNRFLHASFISWIPRPLQHSLKMNRVCKLAIHNGYMFYSTWTECKDGHYQYVCMWDRCYMHFYIFCVFHGLAERKSLKICVLLQAQKNCILRMVTLTLCLRWVATWFFNSRWRKASGGRSEIYSTNILLLTFFWVLGKSRIALRMACMNGASAVKRWSGSRCLGPVYAFHSMKIGPSCLRITRIFACFTLLEK